MVRERFVHSIYHGLLLVALMSQNGGLWKLCFWGNLQNKKREKQGWEMMSLQNSLYLTVQKVKNCKFFLACVTSVSVWIRSKERQKNHEKRDFCAVFDSRSSLFAPKPHENALATQGNFSSLDQKLLPTNLISLCLSHHQYFVLRVR